MSPLAPRRTRRTPMRLALSSVAALAGVVAVPSVAGHAGAPVAPAFTRHTVDQHLAGGEPIVTYYSNNSNGADLAYTSHEGTTHLFRDGLLTPSTICSGPGQQTPSGFACSYDNQVNVWTSTNQGQTWTRTTVIKNGIGGTGPIGPTSLFGLGFSDPDWSTDEGGWLYNTGIDLANDAVFASHDGGRSFPVGNNNCHSGDRPWLAGGRSGEVFLATDTVVDPNSQLSSGHEIFRGAITGSGSLQTLACSGTGGGIDVTGTGSTGIKDYGAWQRTGSYSAAGKLLYDHNTIASDAYHGAIIDPAFFSNSNNTPGVGISVLPHAAQAFANGTASFPQQYEVPGTHSVFAHWPSIALDSNDVVYLVWDTTDGGASALNNAIMLSTFDLKHPRHGFTNPIVITRPGKSVLWPWVAVGSPGNVSVVWYQYNSVTNPDQNTTGKVSLMEENLFGVGSGAPTQFSPLDAVGTPIHTGGICQSGTLCVATGQDRRLGDFFTNAVDHNGCVMIASGETITDPTGAVSRPMFLLQTAGTGLNGTPCAAPPVSTPEVPWAPLLVIGGATAAVLGWRRRRNGVAIALP